MRKKGSIVMAAVLLLLTVLGAFMIPAEISEQYDKTILTREHTERLSEATSEKTNTSIVEKLDLISRYGLEMDVAKSSYGVYYTSAFEEEELVEDFDVHRESIQHRLGENQLGELGEASNLLKPGLTEQIINELEAMQQLGAFPQIGKIEELEILEFGFMEFVDTNNIDAYASIGEFVVKLHNCYLMISYDVEEGIIFQYELQGELYGDMTEVEMKKGMQKYLGISREEINRYYGFEPSRNESYDMGEWCYYRAVIARNEI